MIDTTYMVHMKKIFHPHLIKSI